MQGYTRKDIAEITGLSPRLVQFYTEEAVVTPELDLGKGRGHQRRYSLENVLQFLVIKELSDYGVNLKMIMCVIESLRKKLEEDFKRLKSLGGPEGIGYIIVGKHAGTAKRKIDFLRVPKKINREQPIISLDVLGKYRSALIINFRDLVTRSEEV